MLLYWKGLMAILYTLSSAMICDSSKTCKR